MSLGGRRLGLAAGGTAVALAAITAALLTGAGNGNAESTGARKATSSASVTRQDLVADKTVTGALGYAKGTPIRTRLSGTLTAIPGEGFTVRRGQPLFRINGTPVPLLYGSLPAYRRMTVGTKGQDVRQLETNLRFLGYTGFTVDDSYTSGTVRAVGTWQKRLGLVKTGAVEPAEIVFAPAAIRVGAHKVSLGDEVGPGTVLYDSGGTERVVTIDLEVADQALVRRGLAVSVDLPDGRTATGRITEVGRVARTSSSNGNEADGGGSGGTSKTTVTVTVKLDRLAQAGSWDQAPVAVSFESSRHSNVLTVPVNALLALAEGGYGVEVIDGAGPRILPVKLGMFAQGRVEISGAGVKDGLLVAVPAS